MKLRRARGQRGLSLIEVTIMLLVLMLLTSVLAPSIFDFVQDAQWVKVKEDCEVLAISLARLIKDVGPNLVGVGGGAWPAAKLDLIVSDGVRAEGGPALQANQPQFVMNWWQGAGGAGAAYDPFGVNGGANVATCSEQFITNREGNVAAAAAFYAEAPGPPVGLVWGQGWRGAYLSPPCGPDPWGRAYQINTKWVTNVFANPAPPPDVLTFNHCEDVFCLSPGKDGIIDTPYTGLWNAGPVWGGRGGLFRGGDDWVTIIAPCDP